MNGEVARTEPSIDVGYINRRLDRIERKLRIIVAVLVEKKMIGGALQKAIEESKSTEDIIDWLMKEITK